MKVFYNFIKEIRNFGVLWLTQAFSSLGSSMTNFALILWTYEERGSALTTALLSVCTYAPYVVMSIFAGAISDRWSKKTVMLVCDSFAAACTVGVWFLFITGRLKIWHLYGLNALNGLMNTIQQPASDVTITMVTPKKYYQLASGMRSFSNSLVSILTPVLAAAMYSLVGLHAVILFDLFTFFTAFLSLLFIIEIPEASEQHFWKEIAKVIWSKPTEANINDLKSSKGWWLRRLTWNGERFEYVAGQDYPYEIRQIRKFVKAQSRS